MTKVSSTIVFHTYCIVDKASACRLVSQLRGRGAGAEPEGPGQAPGAGGERPVRGERSLRSPAAALPDLQPSHTRHVERTLRHQSVYPSPLTLLFKIGWGYCQSTIGKRFDYYATLDGLLPVFLLFAVLLSCVICSYNRPLRHPLDEQVW